MDQTPVHKLHVLLFLYKKGVAFLEAANEIRQVLGANAISNYEAQIWYKRFQSGVYDFNVAV